MRGAAWVTGDLVLTELHRAGADLHQENAAMMAGAALEAVTKEMRSAAKAVTFGALYGIGATALAGYAFANYGVEMSVAEAEAALRAFFGRFRVLDRWRRDHSDRCQARGFIEIGCGRVVEAAWEPYGLSFPQCCESADPGRSVQTRCSGPSPWCIAAISLPVFAADWSQPSTTSCLPKWSRPMPSAPAISCSRP